MKILVLTAVLVLGCGTHDGGKAAGSSLADNPTSTVLVDKPQMAHLVASKDLLKPCTAENDSQLVYVKGDGQFYSCEALIWTPIDLNGRDGVDGKDGKDGASAFNIPENHWVDPMSGKTIAIGATMWTGEVSCTSPWRLPANGTEARSFALHGLSEKLGRLGLSKSFWFANDNYIDGSSTSYFARQDILAARVLICVKD